MLHITVYTKPYCKPCDRVKKLLDDAGVEYEEVDLTKNSQAYRYVTKCLGAKSTPVVESSTHEPIIGYQPDKLAELIEYLSSSDTGF